jgi:hypothetical protein
LTGDGAATMRRKKAKEWAKREYSVLAMAPVKK